MNIAEQLPSPLDAFVVDIPAHSYYDFHLEPGSSYPLSGVTYPVDYGNIPGHTAEDGHELDLFVGNDRQGKMGWMLVNRGVALPDEHKFFIAMTSEETEKVLQELQPVLIDHQEITDVTALLQLINAYQDK